MKLQFRPMRPDEIEHCADLWVDTWAATYPEIDFTARRGWFVARFSAYVEGAALADVAVDENGSIIGFASVDPSTGYVDQFAVARDARGKGAARELMRHTQQIAPGFLRLDVNKDNHRAVRFYEREGFMRVGEGVSASGRPSYIYEWKKD